MPEIFLINPRKKSKRKKRHKTKVAARSVARKTTRKVEKMPKRKRNRNRGRFVKNPAPAPAPARAKWTAKSRKYARRAVSRVRTSFAGLNFRGALMNAPWYVIGMLGSKWVSKRFGGGAAESDPESWTWRSYLQGALGSVTTAFAVNLVKRGTGQKVLEGGMALMLYELLQNELIAPNEWAAGQFGEAEDDYSYLPGDVETTPEGRTAMLGEDYQWHQLPESGVSGVLEPVGPLGQLEPVGPLGQLEPVGPLGALDPYRAALLG